MLGGINLSNKDVIGIDFGTTNSAACVYEDGKFEVIPNPMGYDYFPSVVAVNENGELLVGHYARKQMASNAGNSVSEFKLKMGGTKFIDFNGKDKRPQEIAALVYGHIKKNAEDYLDKSIDKAVICVPASFNDDAIKATKEAAEIGGFEVKAIVKEPTAACLMNADTKDLLGTVLVFDIGGGTLDITIGLFDGSELDEKSITGARVGGRDITIALANYVQREFEEQYGLKLEDYKTQEYDPLIDLYKAAEDAKIELSNVKTTNIHIDSFIMTNEGKRINLDIDINRSKLEELSKPVLEKCKEKVNDALSEAKLTKEDIDYLVFVGGPTKMPLIKESIKKVLGKSVVEDADPMLCVAKGASMFLGGPITKPINSLTLSIVTDEKDSDPLIRKGTRLPAEATKEYFTMYDNQTSANIQIVEGESTLAKENHTLHSFTLRGLPRRPAGEVKIQVKLKVNINGMMELSAEEFSNKTKLSVNIDSSKRMSSEEIKKASSDTYELLRNQEEKNKEKEIINDAEEVILKAKDLIENFNDDMLMSDKNMINENIEKLEDLLDNPKNFSLIRIITKKLQKLIDQIESEGLFFK